MNANDPIFMSTTKLAGLLRKKELSAVEAVQMYIKRQTAVNDKLNAVVTNCFERALEEARALDSKAAKGEFVGPLHGVPITIKDSLDTEGVISTGATVGRQAFVPSKDATVVSRVRKARRDPARQDQHSGVHAGWPLGHQHREQPALRRLA